MKTIVCALALLAGSLLPAEAAGCSALDGRTTWDSLRVVTGDPFFGGTWGNAANGQAWIQRTLKSPAKLYSIYLPYAGTDVSSDASHILIKAKLQADGKWKTLFELNDAVVARGFSFNEPRRVGPQTIDFPAIDVTALRVEMSGHGWFDMARAVFYVSGC